MSVILEPVSKSSKQMPTLFCLYDLSGIVHAHGLCADDIRAFRENVLLYIGWWATAAGLTEGYTILSLVVTESQLRSCSTARNTFRRCFGTHGGWTHSWINPNSRRICRLLAVRISLADAVAEFQRTQRGVRARTRCSYYIALRAPVYPAIFKPDEVTNENRLLESSWTTLPKVRLPSRMNGLERTGAFSPSVNTRATLVSSPEQLRNGRFPTLYNQNHTGYPYCCGMNIGFRGPFPRHLPLIVPPVSTSDEGTSTIRLYPQKEFGEKKVSRSKNIRIQTVNWGRTS